MKGERWRYREWLAMCSLALFLATTVVWDLSYGTDFSLPYAGVYRLRSFQGRLIVDNQPLRSSEVTSGQDVSEEIARVRNELAGCLKAKLEMFEIEGQRRLTNHESAALQALEQREHELHVSVDALRDRMLHRRGPVSPLMSHSLAYRYVLAATAPLPLAWLVSLYVRAWKRRNAMRSGLCRSCGYDLRASPNRCPECGTTAY
jgi:hypothetical protein